MAANMALVPNPPDGDGDADEATALDAVAPPAALALMQTRRQRLYEVIRDPENAKALDYYIGLVFDDLPWAVEKLFGAVSAYLKIPFLDQPHLLLLAFLREVTDETTDEWWELFRSQAQYIDTGARPDGTDTDGATAAHAAASAPHD